VTGLESILLGYAVGKIIDISSMYLGDRVLTGPEKKKLTEIIESSLTRVFSEQATGKDDEELRQLQDSFSYLLQQEQVLQHITPTVFIHESKSEETSLGEVTEYHDGMVTAHRAAIVKQLRCYLAEQLIIEAQKKDSPLFHAVSVSLLAVIEENTRKIPLIATEVGHLTEKFSIIGRQLNQQSTTAASTNEKIDQLLERSNVQQEKDLEVQAKLVSATRILSSDVQSMLDGLYHVYRTGKRKEALKALIDAQTGNRWEYLDNAAKAKILRRRAVWELKYGTSLAEVKVIATKAIDLDPEADHTVLDALIAYHEVGYQAAIEIISVPKNAFSYNFLLALKLIHDSPRSALDVFKNDLSFDQDLAESKRLNALALLYTGSPEEALSKLDEITTSELEWRDIKQARALALFWKNIGTEYIPPIVPMCPMPLDINPKDISEASKREIKDQFQIFWSDTINSDIDREEEVCIKLWALACLIYGGATPIEINAAYKKILEGFSVDPRVLWWGMYIDAKLITRDLVVKASKTLATEDSTYVQKVNILTPIMLEHALFDEALELLEVSEDKFNQSENRQAWIQRKSQYLAITDQINDALQLAKDECVDELQIRVSVQMIAAQKEPEKYLLPLANDTMTLFQTQNSDAPLYQVLSTLADRNDWQAIAELFESDLSESLPLEVLEIFVIGLFNDERFEDCKTTLQLIKNRFLKEQFSFTLLRILVLLAKRESNILEELKYAQTLDEVSQFASDKLMYIQALLANGFRDKLLQECSVFIEREDVSKADLLGVAQTIKSDDRALALRIVKKLLPTITKADDSRVIVAAYHLCFELGLEAEIGALHQLVAKIARDPNDNIIWMGSLDDAIKLQQESREDFREQNRMYAKGVLPLHSIVKRLNTSISSIIFHNKELSEQEGLANLPSIYIRHGGTVTSDEDLETIFDQKLKLDTSAILVADTIGALELIVNNFKVKQLPPSIQTVFRNEVDSFPSTQASRIQSSKKILDYIWDNKIEAYPYFNVNFELKSRFDRWMGHKWIALLNHCISNDAFIVDFLPLTRNDGSAKVVKQVRQEARKKIVNARGVIDSLRDVGRISDSQYTKAIAQMGIESTPIVTEALPPLGSDLYCIFNTIEVLHSTGLFDLIVREFNLKIDPAYFDEIKAVVKRDWNRTGHQGWLSELGNRLVVKSEGKSDYYYFSVLTERNKTLKNNDALNCLSEVMNAEDAENTVCWIDDRCIHSFRQVEQKPIVTTYEILRALYLCKRISREDYYGFLIKLRSLNYKYIPLEPEELLFHVHQAKADNNHLLETQEMELLRQYYNSCMVSWNNLQLNPLPENCPSQYGELYFLHEYNRSISSTISMIWSSFANNNLEYIVKQASWVFDAFYTGTYGIRHLRMGADHGSIAAKEDELAVDAGLGLMEVLINVFNENGLRSLKEYQAWTVQKLVDPICKANANSEKIIADMMITFFKKDFLKENIPFDEKRLLQNILHMFVGELPENVKALILTDNEVAYFCGMSISSSVGIDGHNFVPQKFWDACAKTWAGKKPYIQNFDGSNRFKFSLPKEADKKVNTITIKPNGLSSFTFQSPIIPILQANKKETFEVLKEEKDWLDVSDTEINVLVKELDALTSPLERGEHLSRVIAESLVVYYEQLNSTLAASNSLSVDTLLPIAPMRVMGYLRLDNDCNITFKEQLNNAAATLVKENGHKVAFDRLAGIPIELPETFLNTLDDLQSEERREFFKELNFHYQSPVYRIQTLALLSRYTGDKIVDELFNEIWETLHDADKWDNKVSAYQALLSFLDQALDQHEDFEQWSSDARYTILWAHASNVLNSLIRNRMALDSGAKFFAQLSSRLDRKSFFSIKSADELDTLSPELFGQWDFITQLLPALMVAYSNQWPPQVSEFYRSALFPEEGERKSASLALAFNPAGIPNAINSPLGLDRSLVLAPFLATEEQELLSSQKISERTVKLINALVASPEAERDWVQLSMHVRNGVLSSDTQSELLNLSNSLNLTVLARLSPQALLVALSMMPKLIFQTGDLNTATNFREQIIRLTEGFESYEFGDVKVVDEPFDRLIVSAIENALIVLSNMQATSWEQGKQFSEDLYAVYHNLSKYYPEMSYAILKLVLELPIAQTNGLWEALIAIRART